jgi:predicted transcriptional regulator
MNTELLQQIGLNPLQAKAYIALIKSGSLAPASLAAKIKTTRTNAYSLLDKLVELGLAKKIDENKKLTYRPENPIALEKLARRHREAALEQEKLIQTNMPSLLNYFHTYSEQPGVRFFQGKDGIEEIYKDQLRTKQPLYILRSWKDRDFFGKGVYSIWRKRPAKYGIPTNMLSPDVPDANNDLELDRKLLWTRTWMKQEDYTAPVEWNVYGDKVSIISFGEEAIGTIIESPQIAESVRQMFGLMERGLKATPGYDKMPLQGRMADEDYVRNNPEYKELIKDIDKRFANTK